MGFLFFFLFIHCVDINKKMSVLLDDTDITQSFRIIEKLVTKSSSIVAFKLYIIDTMIGYQNLLRETDED